MEITASQTTMKNAMDLYYSWLVELIGPKGNDRIALLSTITTHDIIKDAPLYTNYVFRQFADRTISLSPHDWGKGDTNDRYSRIYRQIVDIAAAELYANAELTDEQQNKIDLYTGSISEAVQEIKAIRTDAAKTWAEQAKVEGLTPGTPQYDLEKAKWYQPYIALLKDQRQKIITAQAKKKAIWLSVFKDDQAGRELSEIYERTIAEDNQQALPTDMNIESKYGLDVITLGAAADSGMFAFEQELGLLPSGTLTRILDMAGVREAEFKKDVVETHNHDREWHASGGGNWGLWSANVSAQEEEHFRQTLQNLESITISCDFMGEYWVNRRDWFSSTIFNNKYIINAMKENPAYAARLALCISSAIIVRGLKITYKFKRVNDTAVWSSYNYSGGGGYGAFGLNFGRVDGGSSGNTYDHIVNTEEKSVTFFDGDNVCRLLALRVTQLMELPLEQIAFQSGVLEDTLWGQELLKHWTSGETPYGSIPAALVGPAGDEKE